MTNEKNPNILSSSEKQPNGEPGSPITSYTSPNDNPVIPSHLETKIEHVFDMMIKMQAKIIDHFDLWQLSQTRPANTMSAPVPYTEENVKDEKEIPKQTHQIGTNESDLIPRKEFDQAMKAVDNYSLPNKFKGHSDSRSSHVWETELRRTVTLHGGSIMHFYFAVVKTC